MITVRTQIKDIIKEAGIDNMSADFMDIVDQKTKELIIAAVKRAKDNGRRTVMGRDL